MSTPLNEGDLIQLNAYLDGELDADEQAQFLHRLARDPELQSELRSIRATKMLLGMAERQPVPRNFTLDPAVYGRPARQSFWERIGLTSIPTWATAGAALVATVICVGVVVLYSDLFTGAGEMPVAMNAPQESAADRAGEPEVDALQAPAAGAEMAEGEAEPAEEPMEAFEAAPAADEAPIEEAAEAVEEEAETAAEETARAAAPPGMGVGAGPSPTQTASEDEADIAGLTVEEPDDAGEAQDGAAPEEAPEPQLQMAEADDADTAADEAPSVEDVRQPRTLLVVGLAAAIVAALIFGVWAAFRVSRRR